MAGAGPDQDVRRILEQAGIPPGRAAAREPVRGGTYNTLFRVTAADGTRLVLKLPPGAGTPGLGYERGLLQGETAYFRAVAGPGGVPVPSVVHAETGPDGQGGHLLMTECPGESWSTLADTVGVAERSRLRESLGGMLARAHSVPGPGFGYPAESVAPLSGSWRHAFGAMLDAVLRDAARYGAWLPEGPSAVRALAEAAAPALDRVGTPVPVHFDLWEGNILLDGTAGSRRISGIVDGERMFWGDPLAELPSLLLFGAAEDDPWLMAGYHGGAAPRLGEAARIRVALYRCYLYLIMLVETVPRRSSKEDAARVRDLAGAALEQALATLARLTRGRP